MLDQAMVDLRASSTSKSNDKNFYVKAMDLAIAKVEFVKVYLEDSTMPLPAELAEKTTEDGAAGEAQQTKDTASTSAPETSSPSQPKEHEPKSDKPGITTAASNEKSTAEDTNPDTSETAPKPATPKVVPIVEPLGVEGKIDEHSVAEPTRPSAPLPTRSSIAQSNFAWMLEPDESSNTTSRSPPLKSSTPFLKSARKPTSGASRDKAAFLFGEEGNDSDANRTKSPFSDADAGFNLGTLKGGKGKSSS
jgi:TBC1 domain family protein 5